MTIEQIEESLPNGLHDAEICNCLMDYERTCLTLGVIVLIGSPNELFPDCERRRHGTLTFHGVIYYSAGLPRFDSSFRHPGPLGFSYERTSAAEINPELWKTLPTQCQCYTLFVRDWLSNMYIAAEDVNFAWSTSEGHL